MNFKDIKTDDDMLDFLEERYAKLKPLFSPYTTGILPASKVHFYLLKNSKNGAMAYCCKRKGYYAIGFARKTFTTMKEVDETMIHEMAHLALFRHRALTADADHKTHAHCKCWKRLMLNVKRNKANPYR